jgi:hypothetical protein
MTHGVQEQRAEAAKLGIPYWMDDTSYLDLNLSLAQWSWQFFRRNNDYRKFYNDRLGPYFRDETNDDPINDLRKFGVMLAGYPSEMDTNRVGLSVALVTEYRPAPVGSLSTYCHDPLTAIYMIDLRVSIDQQIASIRRDARAKIENKADQLKAFKKDFRAAQENYAKYLRVLDALDVGAKPSDVAAALSSRLGYAGATPQTINDWKTAANRLRQSGYLNLYRLGAAGKK